MKDVSGGKLAGPGNNRLTRFALADRPANLGEFPHHRWTGGTMYRSVDATPSGQARIRGVNDNVNLCQGDVTLYQPERFSPDGYCSDHTEFYRRGYYGLCDTMRHRCNGDRLVSAVAES
jgi:hypothetical protein